MVNQVVLQGRLTAAPELKETQSGNKVCSFTLAVERNFVKAGEERKTDFFRCVAWRNTAEFLVRYFTKGQMLILEGFLEIRQYTDKEGNPRTMTQVVVDNLHFCGKKEGEDSPKPEQEEGLSQGAFTELDVTADDDLPF